MSTEPVPLETVWRWIDEHAHPVDAEAVDIHLASGRVPMDSPRAAADVPPSTSAVEDGYALRAEDTQGAGPYNPLSCRLMAARDGPLQPGAAARIGAGEPLPAGADAVLPFGLAAPEGDGRIGVLTPVAAGCGIVLAASELRAGDPLWPGRRHCQPLRPAEIGLLGAAGLERVAVVGRPRTRILLGDVPDLLGPMLQAQVERDGGAVAGLNRPAHARADNAALTAGVDVVLVAGTIESDLEVALRGVAIEPGRETCLARIGATIIVVLPAVPAACFWAYELVAGRAVRRRGGRDPGLAYPSRALRTTRKIVSTLGLTEVVPVRLDADHEGAVTPLPGGRSTRLRTAAEADGFTLVPASSEGSAAGSQVTVWLFEPPPVRDASDG